MLNSSCLEKNPYFFFNKVPKFSVKYSSCQKWIRCWIDMFLANFLFWCHTVASRKVRSSGWEVCGRNKSSEKLFIIPTLWLWFAKLDRLVCSVWCVGDRVSFKWFVRCRRFMYLLRSVLSNLITSFLKVSLWGTCNLMVFSNVIFEAKKIRKINQTHLKIVILNSSWSLFGRRILLQCHLNTFSVWF